MSKNKLERFAENETFPNLFQHTDFNIGEEDFLLKGKWRDDYFKNEYPVTLELGCGRGEYTLALAKLFPERNFIGIDRKGARLWRGCKNALEQRLSNVAFLRIGIDSIANYFAVNEVSEIWITFPDPQPKKPKRRLVSPEFVARYKHVLEPEGVINLKTDSCLLYQYVKETAEEQQWKVISDVENIYTENQNEMLTDIQTYYEKMWLKEKKTISFFSFST